MICARCGVRNVDFASTCFSCRQPLGSFAPAAAASPVRGRRPAARAAAPGEETRGGDPAAGRLGGIALRVLLWAAVAWVVMRGLPVTLRLADPGSNAVPARAEKPVRAVPPAPPAPQAPESSGIEEQNGFRLVRFEWGTPAASGGRYHVGETVTGRSEIQGFGVTADRRIDVTVALAFRDPAGRLVEPISPTVLRQPVESETLFTTFDYAIPAGGLAGEYELELAVDDAVSGRAARFHRRVSVEAGRSQ